MTFLVDGRVRVGDEIDLLDGAWSSFCSRRVRSIVQQVTKTPEGNRISVRLLGDVRAIALGQGLWLIRAAAVSLGLALLVWILAARPAASARSVPTIGAESAQTGRPGP